MSSSLRAFHHVSEESTVDTLLITQERANKGRKGKKNDDEYILAQQFSRKVKWTEDEDLALREFYEQFGSKPNAPQIIATLFDGKSALQVAQRLNKLGMASLRGGDWSEDEFYEDQDEEENESSLSVCARRLRNKAPAALDWIIDCYGLACDTRDETLQAAKLPEQHLPEDFFEVQDFAIVPVVEAEWEHLINPVTMRLMSAMGCMGPRPLEGKAFWRIAADALRDDARTASVLDELLSAQSADIEEEVALPADESEDEARPRGSRMHAYESEDEGRARALETEATVTSPVSSGLSRLAEWEQRQQPLPVTSVDQQRTSPRSREHSPPTRPRQKRRIQLQDSDSEEEPPPKDIEPQIVHAAQEHGGDVTQEAEPLRRKKAMMDDTDDDEPRTHVTAHVSSNLTGGQAEET